MRNGKKMRKIVCLLMSVGMVFSGNTFTGYSAQAETLDEITLLEDSVPVFVSGEVGKEDFFTEDVGDGLPDADVTDDILFVDETLTDPATDSIEDVNSFENADDHEYIEYSDEFEELESITEADEIVEEKIADEVSEESVIEESINAAEESGTDAGIVVDGQSFVDALGGSEYASYTLSSENNYTVTLLSDVKLDHELQLQSGSFVLAGSGTISRAEGYTGTLLKIYNRVSLTLGGNAILDGGAIWKKDGEPSSPAEGAANSGASSTGCLVDNEGSFTLTDSAVIQNNDATGGKRAGAIVSTGPVSMQGGVVQNCDGKAGSILAGNGSSFTMSGGEIYGNRGTSDDYWSGALINFNSDLTFTGGTIRNNTGRALAYTHNKKLTVTGGNYTDNSGYVFFGSMYGNGIFISGGAFSGNGGAADAAYETYTTIHLSGDPVFATERDLLRGPVVIDGTITNDQDYVLIPIKTDLGYQAVGGNAELVAAYHGRFILSGEGTAGLVVNGRGRIDTNPTSMVSDGPGFVEALGGSEYASFTESGGVCTITLSRDTVRSNSVFVESGTYILTGSGTISRAEGYTGTILKISNQASVTLGGEVVLDGGAVWRKDGSPSSPAEGAANSGVVSTSCLVDNEGSFTLTDSAVIQNNDATGGYRAGAIVSTGPVSMQGGIVRNCDGEAGSILSGNGSSFTMSGGEIYGNRGTRDDYWSGALIDFNSDLTFTGGTIRNNTGRALAYTHNKKLTVTGGNYTDNSGYVFFGSMYGDGIFISGGAFSGNGGAADAAYETYTTIHLSGDPVFATERDLLRGPVVIDGTITNDQDYVLIPIKTDLGYQAVGGNAELVAAYHGRFILSGEGTAGLVVNGRGRIDTNPTSMVSDGPGFVEALGGSEYASFTESGGVCTITLSRDTVRSNSVFVESGTYILTGSGTISRAEGYTGTILKISNQASVTLGGEVVLDGGAVWRKDGSPSSPAEGAANSGVVSTSCLVDNEGSFTLTDSAVIQNNDATGGYRAGAIVSTGPVSMQGGIVRNCDGEAGSILSGNGSSFTMSGGEIYGNRGTRDDYWSGALIDFNSDLTFTGGTIRNNTGRALAYTHNKKLTVTGGNYTDNSGYVFFGSMYGDGIFISGGVFSGNGGAADASYETYTTIHLSGNPVFVTERDLLRGQVVIEGAITSETDINVIPNSYDTGTVVVQGTGNYTISADDAGKFRLSHAPQRAVLSFTQSNNRILITYMTPVLVQAAPNEGGVVYDGDPVEPGVDFSVSVYLYEDNIQGDSITENYMAGGGLLTTWYEYRKVGSAGDYTKGLPVEAGKYTINVEVSPDNVNYRAAGQCSFTLEISPKIVEFQVTGLSDVYYSGTEYTPVPDVCINDAGDAELGKDYTLSYDNNLTPGTCTVTAVGIGNYEGSTGSTTFEILGIPILVDASAEPDIVYDGSQIKEDEDFHVQVYIYKDGVRGDVITVDYTGEDAASGFTYQYRGEDASEDNFTDGLPKAPGSYVIRVTAEKDIVNYRDSASTEFSLTISEGPTVTWMNGTDVMEKDDNHPYGITPSYDGAVPAKTETEQYSYVFAGWASEDGQETGTPAADLPAVTGDITYYAAFSKTINQYTVTFTDGFGNVLKTQKLEYGNAAVAPTDPSCAGYTFDGWDGDYSCVTADLTVTATWVKVTADVSFDANGGSGTMEPVSMTTGDPVPGCDFTAPKDKKFKEWNTKADGSGGSYQPGDSIIAESDLVLYAQWENAAPPLPEKIIKAANPLTVKGKTVKIKYSKLKKKKQKLAVSKAIEVTGAQGTVTYKLVSVKKAKFKKYFKVDAKTGKITVKKKLKKGTYKVKVKVTAAGNDNYNSLTKTVTFKVKVK